MGYDINEVIKMTIYQLREMDPFDFEEYVAQLFRDKGYKCYVTSSNGDYGVDVIAEKEDEKIAIQCKRYAYRNRVGVKDIYPIFTGASFYNCNKVMLVTTSRLNNKAKMLARSLDIKVIDYKELGTIANDYDMPKALSKEGVFRLTTEQKVYIAFWAIVFFISLYVS